MTSRVATAAIGIPLVILLVWAGTLWFLALVTLIAAIGAIELANMESERGRRPAMLYAVLGSVGLVVVAQFFSDPSATGKTFTLIIAVGAAFSLVWLFLPEFSQSRWVSFLSTAATALYVGGLLFYAPVLRGLEDGFAWAIFLMFATYATDTLAFFVGSVVGRHLMAPQISPSKTWEGAVGGVIGAVAASVVIGNALPLDMDSSEFLVLGALMGVVGQLGDLAESRVKRLSGVKDSGWIVPGHGGVLDRLDSFVFNLVVVYYFVS